MSIIIKKSLKFGVISFSMKIFDKFNTKIKCFIVRGKRNQIIFESLIFVFHI